MCLITQFRLETHTAFTISSRTAPHITPQKRASSRDEVMQSKLEILTKVESTGSDLHPRSHLLNSSVLLPINDRIIKRWLSMIRLLSGQ